MFTLLANYFSYLLCERKLAVKDFLIHKGQNTPACQDLNDRTHSKCLAEQILRSQSFFPSFQMLSAVMSRLFVGHMEKEGE